MDVTALRHCACWPDYQCGQVNGSTFTDVGVAETSAPARNIALLPAHDDGMGFALELRQEIAAIHRWTLGGPRGGVYSDGSFGAWRRPFLDWVSCDREHVVASLRRQVSRANEKVAYALRAGIIGGGGEPEIAELCAQLGQELPRLGQRLGRVERLKQVVLGGSARHELCDA